MGKKTLKRHKQHKDEGENVFIAWVNYLVVTLPLSGTFPCKRSCFRPRPGSSRFCSLRGLALLRIRTTFSKA